MCLDQVCPPAGVTRSELEEAVRRTTLVGGAAARGAAAPTGSCCSGSPRAGPTATCAGARSTRSPALDFDGNAIGGLSIGEGREQMFELTGSAAPLLPAEKPRYFMGIGDPQGILEVIERGDRHVRLRPADPARRAPARR